MGKQIGFFAVAADHRAILRACGLVALPKDVAVGSEAGTR
jgi:hypothetical protein